MGQSVSNVGVTGQQVGRQAVAMATLSYKQFILHVQKLNAISLSLDPADRKRLLFAIKKGTDHSLLWKATVRVACVRVNTETGKIESYRLLNLKQFLQVHHTITSQAEAHTQRSASLVDRLPEVSMEDDPSACLQNSRLNFLDCDDETLRELEATAVSVRRSVTPLTTSALLERLSDESAEAAASLDECCICLERKPDVILPCAHSYCLPCIEQWNDAHKTCPVCRELVQNTDDSWVISEAPEIAEVKAEIQRNLNKLTDDS